MLDARGDQHWGKDYVCVCVCVCVHVCVVCVCVFVCSCVCVVCVCVCGKGVYKECIELQTNSHSNSAFKTNYHSCSGGTPVEPG